MDAKRSWPWRKKSLEKMLSSTDSADSSPVQSSNHPDDQDLGRILTDYGGSSSEMPGKLHQLEERLKTMNDRLSDALRDVSAKEELAKQHAKVAEEAVSGWEKSESEAVSLKQQLEAARRQNIAAEDRALHLDGALKECMRQLRHVREEQEQKIHDAIVMKTREFDKVRSALEEKLEDVGHRLLVAQADNDAISKSHWERAKTISEIKQTLSQTESELNVSKIKISSIEKENATLKYEIHVLNKEIKIRNEEREISEKAADAANKNHLENIKKVAKLETECQRLRMLVRKKLPGPAALAQMKAEVGTLGRENNECNRRSGGKGTVLAKAVHVEPVQGSFHDLGSKETQAFLDRIHSMEGEIKMLKEALAKRNNELQATRLMCARTASKLSSAEEQLAVMTCSQGAANSPRITVLDMETESAKSVNMSKEPSLASYSEDGNDDELNCAESWASALITELAQFKKEKVNLNSDKELGAPNAALINDFVDMEQLAARSPTKSENAMPELGSTIGISHELSGYDRGNEIGGYVENDKKALEKIVAKREEELQAANQLYKEVSSKLITAQEQLVSLQSKNTANESTLVNLQEKLVTIFEALEEGGNIGNVLEQIRSTVGASHNSVARLQSHNCGFSKCSCLGGASHIESSEGSGLADHQHISAPAPGYSSSEDEIPCLTSSVEPKDACMIGPELTSTIRKVVRIVEDLIIVITGHQFAVFPDRSSQHTSVCVGHAVDSGGKYINHMHGVHCKDMEIDGMTRKFIAVSNQFLDGKKDIVHFMSELSSVLGQLTSTAFLASGSSPQRSGKSTEWGRSSSGGSEHEELSGAISPVSETSKSDGCEKEVAKIVPAHEFTPVFVDALEIEKELQKVRAEKMSLESHMREESDRLVCLEDELVQLRKDKVELENNLEVEKEKLQHFKAYVHEVSVNSLRLEEKLQKIQVEKQALESQMRAELDSFLGVEEELRQLRRDKVGVENIWGIEKEKLEECVASLRVQLSSAEESKLLAEEQLRNMASSILNFENQLKAAEVELSQLHDNVQSLEQEVMEERKQNEDLKAKYEDFQKQLQNEAGSNCGGGVEARLDKNEELAAAAEKLAECQRTILALGKQLNALGSPKSVDLPCDSQAHTVLTVKQILSENDSISPQTDRSLSGWETSEANNTGLAFKPKEISSHFPMRARHRRFKLDTFSNSRESDISEILDSELFNLSNVAQASRRTMIDLFGDRTPVHADYIEAVAQMPSSPEEQDLPPKPFSKRVPRKNKSSHSSAGFDLTKAMEHTASLIPSEKHGKSFSRYFARKKGNK